VSVRIEKSLECVMVDPIGLQEVTDTYAPAVGLSPEMLPIIFTPIGSPMKISFYALLIVLFA